MGTPSVPKPTPVIPRQPYKDPVPRGSLTGNTDSETSYRRMIAGVVTGAQGLADNASTTRRVQLGGDQQLAPVLGGADSSTGTPPATTPTNVGGGTPAPQTGTRRARANPDFVNNLITRRLRSIVGP